MPHLTLGRLLIVDDEIELLNSLADKLARQGYETVRFSSPREALNALESESFDLLLTDLMMPGMDGIALLQAARRIDPYLAGIVMTGQATVQTAVDAFKMGALDYVLKPFTISVILPVLARALETRRLRLENIQLRETVGIYELCNAIAFTLDHQTLLNKIADAAMQQCEAEEASIMLPTDGGKKLRVAAVRGESREHLLGERITIDQGIAGWVARHHEPLALSGVVADPRFSPVCPRPDIRSAISMPMIVGGRLVGVINVNSTSRRYPFTMGQVKSLNILANTGAAALENAQLHLAIRQAEENYRSIFENASEGILRSTPDGRVQIANPAMARMLGYDSPEEFINTVQDLGKQVYRRPEDRAEVLRRIEETGQVRELEVEMVRKDGGRVWVSLNCRAIRDRQGNTIRYDSTHADITDRKFAERLSAAEHRVATILAAAPSLSAALADILQTLGDKLERDWCAIWLIDPERQVLRWAEVWHAGAPEAVEFESYCRSQSFERGVGLAGRVWEKREPVWTGNIAEERDFPRAVAARQAGYRGALAFPLLLNGVVVGVIEFFSKMAREPESSLLRTLGTVGSQIGQFIERRQIEEERDRFFELSVDMLCVARFDGVFQLVNPAWTATLGWSAEEFTGRRYDEFVHPDDRLASAAEHQRLTSTGGFTLSFENRYRCKDGTYKWLSWRVVTDVDRRVVYGSARDTTEKRQAEADLHLRDRAIQAVAQGIVITDPNQDDNPIVYASPGFERLTGYTAHEAVGRNCRMLQGKDTDPERVIWLRNAIRNASAYTVELLNYRKDGTSFWNELSISPVRDTEGRLTHFVGVQTDVTERRQMEDRFRQAQKMQAIGKLAAGVAHDFNNLLTIINGYSDMLLQSLPEDDPSRALLAEIHHAGERSVGLTRQLLAFSRQQVLAPKVLDLNTVVTNAERMLRRMIGEDVRLATALNPELSMIRADPGQIEQVLLNLAVNARDAMPTGGQLTIETRNVELNEDYTRAHPGVQNGSYVLLAVSDTGCGMTDEVKSRIFEPFFTTKEPGKGTGLGLATVYGIIQQSGGAVDVYSELGVGTTFKVYFPWATKAPGSGVVPLAQRSPPQGTEAVLLVEDEDAVRTLTRHVLVGCGYTVLEAADGEEAIRIADAYPKPIHLLITDVVMPGLGGRLVAERVAARHPSLRILFVSGYTDDAVVRHGVLSERANFLQKPFSPTALAIKVREVLDEPD